MDDIHYSFFSSKFDMFYAFFISIDCLIIYSDILKTCPANVFNQIRPS